MGFFQTNIGDYKNIGDWSYILLAILIVDIVVLFLTRFFPDALGRNLNVWYEQFGLSAVLSDVFVIAIGFAIARHAYSYFFPDPRAPFRFWSFLGILVGTQAIHDILFYLFVILPIPRGHNRMMDVFRDYATAGGKIIVADGAMMVASALIAMMLKSGEPSTAAFVGLTAMYTLPYILETKNKHSLR